MFEMKKEKERKKKKRRLTFNMPRRRWRGPNIGRCIRHSMCVCVYIYIYIFQFKNKLQSYQHCINQGDPLTFKIPLSDMGFFLFFSL